MIENEIFLIDSNILIYAYAEKDENKELVASNLLIDCWNGKIKLAVSSQNFAEFLNVSYKKYRVDIKEIETIISDLIEFNGFLKINYSEITIMKAINLMKEFDTKFWDSLLAATMKESGIFNIYTENTKDFKIPWINSVNPFDKK